MDSNRRVGGIILIVAVLSVFSTGCAGFKSRKLEQVNLDEVSFRPTDKTKIFSRWRAESQSAFANDNFQVAFAAIHKKKFETAIDATNCCIVVESPGDADVVIDGIAYDDSNRGALFAAILTGASLYVIPSWLTSTTRIKVEALRGSVSTVYSLSDSSTMVQWLPMLFAFPFANPFDAEKEVSENVFNTLLIRMNVDGMFAAKAQ